MMEWNVHMGISQPVTAALQLFFRCSVKELQLFCRLGSTGLSHTTWKSWSSQLEAAWHTWIFPRTVIKLVFQSSIYSFANNIAMQYWNSAMFCSFQEQHGFRKTHGYVTGLVQDPSSLSTRFWHHFSFLDKAANLVTTEVK